MTTSPRDRAIWTAFPGETKRNEPSPHSRMGWPMREDCSRTMGAMRRMDGSMHASAQIREPMRPDAPYTMMCVDLSMMDLQSGTM